MMWNLFCFHMLEEPPVLLRITYRDHWFKTFRCCGSSASLPFPLAASCSQPVISPHSLPSPSLSLSPPLPSVLPVSQTLYKTDECLRAGSVPVVLGGNFPQHSRPTVYICHFLLSPSFEASSGGGCGSGVWGEALCAVRCLEIVPVPPLRFYFILRELPFSGWGSHLNTYLIFFQMITFEI